MTPNAWPNLDAKPAGCYVEAVHPCTVGRYPLGLVLTSEAGASEPHENTNRPTLAVAIGKGSTVYGPARHWRPTDRRPEWLDR